MGFQAGVLNALRPEGLLVDDVRLRIALLHVAEGVVDLSAHVVLGAEDPRLRALVVQDGGAREHGLLRVDHVRELLVRHDHATAALLGLLLAVGDDGRHPLADEADHVVQDPGVHRVLGGVLMAGGRVQPVGGVVVGEDGVHAGDLEGVPDVDVDDPGVRVRRAQQLHVQQPGHLDVEGVAGGAGDDERPRGGAQGPAHGLPGLGVLRVLDPLTPRTASSMAR